MFKLMLMLLVFLIPSKTYSENNKEIIFSTDETKIEILDNELFYTGAITLGAIEVVKFQFNNNDNLNTLNITSFGGLAYAGYDLAFFIKNNNIIVKTDRVCASACAFIAMGANDLIIKDNTILAFHLPYVDANYFIENNLTIDEVNRMNNTNILHFIYFIDQIGYSFDFVQHLSLNTAQDVYMIFLDKESLYYYKFDSDFFDSRKDIKYLRYQLRVNQ